MPEPTMSAPRTSNRAPARNPAPKTIPAPQESQLGAAIQTESAPKDAVPSPDAQSAGPPAIPRARRERFDSPAPHHTTRPETTHLPRKPPTPPTTLPSAEVFPEI